MMKNIVIVFSFTYSILMILYYSKQVKRWNDDSRETKRAQTQMRTGDEHDNNNNFVIHGKWMQGKRHNQTCDFIPKTTCCKNKQNLHFEFHEDRLNEIDAVEELRKLLKTKKMLLIGDSIMSEFFVGVSELLHLNTEKKTENFCGTKCTIHPGNNGTVTFLEACIIELKGQKKLNNIEKWRIVSEEVIRREIPKYDIILFNQGQHHSSRFLISESPFYFTNIGKMLHGKNKK